MTAIGQDTLNTRTTLVAGGKSYDYFSLAKAAQKYGSIDRLPFSMKVLLENMLRFEDGKTVTEADVQAIVDWQQERRSDREIQYRPARVLMQDFTGVPCVVDLAAMRDAITGLGGDAAKINPQVPVHLVIDHSVMVDEFGTPQAAEQNVEIEYSRNMERYEFLKWGSKALDNFQVVPPGTGICHQVNLEYIGQAVWSSQAEDGATIAYPDTLVGTDSHTTMINGLGVLGWGVGGIEAEAAMLGQPVSMLIPEVVGFKLTGQLAEGITATDLVLTVTQMLRAKGVVGRFVEFYGPGLDHMTLADRATIANMAPEYGATCGFFPVDDRTMDYLRLTARPAETIALVEAYAKAQGLWRHADMADPVFTDTLELDMSCVCPVARRAEAPAGQGCADLGRRRVQRRPRQGLSQGSCRALPGGRPRPRHRRRRRGHRRDHQLHQHLQPVRAGRRRTRRPQGARGGPSPKPWVKTSLAPGSQVVTDYLDKAGLTADLDAMGFNLVGYGCTTCIGNSGPLASVISTAINDNDLVAASVLSGNRNFEGRVSPDVRANFLASPPLVVAYALKGTVTQGHGPVADRPGKRRAGRVSQGHLAHQRGGRGGDDRQHRRRHVRVALRQRLQGDGHWRGITVEGSDTYTWRAGSTYINNPPYFEGLTMTPAPVADIRDARPLAILGDSITTDHISPAGSIKADSRRAPSCRNIRSRARTSTAMARGAAMTSSWSAAPLPTSASATRWCPVSKAG